MYNSKKKKKKRLESVGPVFENKNTELVAVLLSYRSLLLLINSLIKDSINVSPPLLRDTCDLQGPRIFILLKESSVNYNEIVMDT